MPEAAEDQLRLFQCGLESYREGRLADAEQHLRELLNCRPDHFDALHLAGVIARQCGDNQRAVELIFQAIAVNDRIAAAHRHLGDALADLGHLDVALSCYDTAIALRADDPLAFDGRGMALLDLQRPEEAVESLRQALSLAPDYAQAWNNLGISLNASGRHDEAVASFERSISLAPEDDRPYLNCAHTYLQTGRFERGWDLYEWRAKVGRYVTPAHVAARSAWDGREEIRGKTLYVYCEQGLGDTIQFCRYANLAAARGARVVLSVQPSLIRILRGLNPSVDVISEALAPAQFDFHCPLLSLPRSFGTTLATIPAAVPYLRPEPERVEHWRRFLGTQGFKVGIGWQGGVSAVDVGRSFPVASFEKLATLPGVRLISLQKGAGTEQLASLSPELRIETLGEFDTGPDAFLDTAAVVQNLDLVISSDTALAHLAGALGRQTWVVLKHSPDWRWLLERTDSPWYPRTVLFRQRRNRDWAGVFEDVHRALSVRLTPP